MFAKKIIVAALLALTMTTLFAREAYVNLEQRLTSEQMKATGLDNLKPEQLALLNQILSDASSKQIKQEQVARRDNVNEPMLYAGMDDKPITTRVRGSISGWEPGIVFELDNGQTWKVLKGSMKLRDVRNNPEVILVPGMAGRWFLQVDEDLPKARIYRID
jgi:hypothetical protein